MHADRTGRFGASPAGVVALAVIAGALLLAPRAGGSSEPPAVLTLEEAARMLRVPAADVERLAREGELPGRRIGTAWRFGRDALLAWLGGRAVGDASRSPPRLRLSTAVGEPLPRSELVATRGAGRTAAAPGEANATPAPSIGVGPDSDSAESVFLRDQSVLLDRGEASIELGVFYSLRDRDEIVLARSGATTVPLLASVEEEAFTTIGTVRYGVLDRTQLFASLPLRAATTTLRAAGAAFEDDDAQLGPIALGVRRSVLAERGGWPEVVLSLEGRVPVDQSSWAIGGGLALIKNVDPAALFASLGYLHTFSRDFADPIRLEPVDTLDATLGYALALNDRLSISTSLSASINAGTRFTAASLRQDERYVMRFALTSLLFEGLYVEPSVSFGLGDAGDDVTFGLTIPYTFRP